jgi:hypothetical protein
MCLDISLLVGFSESNVTETMDTGWMCSPPSIIHRQKMHIVMSLGCGSVFMQMETVPTLWILLRTVEISIGFNDSYEKTP